MKHTIYCDALPNIPWQDKPAGCESPLWRYTENPIIGRNPLPGVARIFNSAVVPYEDGFIGVFRGEQLDGIPYIYLGRSADGIHWDFDRDKIPFVNGKGEPFMPQYAYDPRLVKIEDTTTPSGVRIFTVLPSASPKPRISRPLHVWKTPSSPSTAMRCCSPGKFMGCIPFCPGPATPATPPSATFS